MGNNRKKASSILILFMMVIFSLLILFPIYWVVKTSITPETEMYKLPLNILPTNITIFNYIEINQYITFFRFFINSVFVSLSSSVLSVLSAMLAGYSLARFFFKGKQAIKLSVIITQMFPVILLIIPLLIIYRRFHLVDNLFALIFTYTTLTLPFGIILFEGLFLGIPVEIEECARIDGCSYLGALFRVTAPAMAPGIAACFAFAFVGSWSEMFAGIMFLNTEKNFTLPIGLFMLIGKYEVQWGALSAGIVISLIPALIMFFYSQKYMVSGLTAGAVKS
jgi:multiple sugar transport system permease protein